MLWLIIMALAILLLISLAWGKLHKEDAGHFRKQYSEALRLNSELHKEWMEMNARLQVYRNGDQ